MEVKKYPVLKWLFQKYQDGSLDQQKKELVDEWFEQYNEDEHVNLLGNPEEKERIYQELSQRVKQAIKPARVSLMWPPQAWLKVACLLLVATLAGWYIYQPHTKSKLSIAAFDTVTTANRQVKRMVLADGTEIWLNSAARLRISRTYKTKKDRTVYLDKGEAFFNVKHDASRPFSVITGNFITRDIGTSFNIRAYDLENEYRVAVVSGKVAVLQQKKSGGQQIISTGIIQGQVLSYNSQTYIANITHQDTRLMSIWKTGDQFYADKMTLTQIGGGLARRFNLKVTVVHPEYDTTKYTLYLGNHSIQETLQQLTLKTGMSYRLQNNNLTINPSNKLNDIR